MAVYRFRKRLGETPLQALSRLRIEQDIAEDVPVTYAGRLDPAAVGEMIFLSKGDIADKQKCLSASKIYEVTFILGLATDTADLMGKVTDFDPSARTVSSEEFQNACTNLSGTRHQPYHAFSSKAVDGKPLWQHAREGNPQAVDHEVTFHTIELLSSESRSVTSAYGRVTELTSLITGDFRQPEILESWQSYKDSSKNLQTFTVRIHSSSGAYMRVLGEEIGKALNIPVCAYSIERKEIILP